MTNKLETLERLRAEAMRIVSNAQFGELFCDDDGDETPLGLRLGLFIFQIDELIREEVKKKRPDGSAPPPGLFFFTRRKTKT